METHRAKRVASAAEADVADRQNRVKGFSTEALQGARVLLIGAGGLGSGYATGLCRKGIGYLRICDGDVVEASNLTRQSYYVEDLYQPKALRLARNAAREGCLGTVCEGHHVDFTDESAPKLGADVDVAVCGVDNNAARAAACRYFRQQRKPCIFTAIDDDGSFGWVFVQRPDGPCLGCVYPHMLDGRPEPNRCAPVGAVLDILRVCSGVVLRAIDSLVMERARGWDYHSVTLVGTVPGQQVIVEHNPQCPACGGAPENVQQSKDAGSV
ncbi:MAG: ThiF family adenylyltransferase [Planctomycetales bacterium]